jgi:hypothetical protein
MTQRELAEQRLRQAFDEAYAFDATSTSNITWQEWIERCARIEADAIRKAIDARDVEWMGVTEERTPEWERDLYPWHAVLPTTGKPDNG